AAPESRSTNQTSLHIQESADAPHQFIDIERLVQEVVGTRLAQLLDLVLLDHPRNANNLDIGHGGVAANQLANPLSINIRQHDIKDDEVGVVFFGEHPGAKSAVDDLGLEPRVAGQNLGNQVDDSLIVIHNQDAPPTTFKRIGRDAILLHKPIE